MKYERKTRDVFEIQGDYGQGFEIVTAEDNRKDARERLKEYRENEPGIAFRIKKTREQLEHVLTAKPQSWEPTDPTAEGDRKLAADMNKRERIGVDFISKCANCEWIGDPEIGLAEIPDLLQRIEPGGIVPSGECPDCGALCYEQGSIQ